MVSIFFPISKNNGTDCHSTFDIKSIPDFTSPNNTIASGFSDSIIDKREPTASWTSSFGSTWISLDKNVFSNPICKSVTTR